MNPELIFTSLFVVFFIAFVFGGLDLRELIKDRKVLISFLPYLFFLLGAVLLLIAALIRWFIRGD
ncbi:hypothetical protein ACJ8LR_25980 [Serratia sp. CY56810]|uniref:hypothetical protein n=1 Tax=Serratia sp. CY56810 TaxID=3383642 RepID=UPI003FA160CC